MRHVTETSWRTFFNLQERWNSGEKIGFAVRHLPKAVQKNPTEQFQDHKVNLLERSGSRTQVPSVPNPQTVCAQRLLQHQAAGEIFINWSEWSKTDWFKGRQHPGWCIHEEQNLHRTWTEQPPVNGQSEEESVTCYCIFNITGKCFIHTTRMQLRSLYAQVVWINNLFSCGKTRQAWALCGVDISAQNRSSPAVMHDALTTAPPDDCKADTRPWKFTWAREEFWLGLDGSGSADAAVPTPVTSKKKVHCSISANLLWDSQTVCLPIIWI